VTSPCIEYTIQNTSLIYEKHTYPRCEIFIASAMTIGHSVTFDLDILRSDKRVDHKVSVSILVSHGRICTHILKIALELVEAYSFSKLRALRKNGSPGLISPICL
jgi:hypothetical protein